MKTKLVPIDERVAGDCAREGQATGAGYYKTVNQRVAYYPEMLDAIRECYDATRPGAWIPEQALEFIRLGLGGLLRRIEEGATPRRPPLTGESLDLLVALERLVYLAAPVIAPVDACDTSLHTALYGSKLTAGAEAVAAARAAISKAKEVRP